MPIITFEDFTEVLSEEEVSYLPYVLEAFKSIEKPTTSADVCNLIQMFYWKKNETHLPMNGPRLRKFVNHIRTKGLLPIIATSQGYFVSYDKKIITNQIQSLNQRASSIKSCSDGLKKFLDDNS